MRKPLINPGIIKRLKSFFAIIQDTDTATRYIPAGKYVLYKNIACHASQNIESGDTLALGTNLVTDSDGFVNCLNDGLSELNNKIATYDFGTNTLANLQTAIITYAETLSNQSIRNISFAVSEVEGVFIQTRYIGQLIKTMSGRINVEVRQALTDIHPIIGKYTNGTWEWDKIALNSKTTLQIADNMNLNNVLTQGIYRSPMTVSGVSTLSNCPVDAPFTMIVTGDGDIGGCVQTISKDNDLLTRRGTSGGFGNWTSFALNSNYNQYVDNGIKCVYGKGVVCRKNTTYTVKLTSNRTYVMMVTNGSKSGLYILSVISDTVYSTKIGGDDMITKGTSASDRNLNFTVNNDYSLAQIWGVE